MNNFEVVPNHEDFVSERLNNITKMSIDLELRKKAINFQIECDKYKYTYQFEWNGVPIIRLPDDILVFQELLFHLKPNKIIETGVARGGSIILSASLLKLNSKFPRVLGIDIKIHPHTKDLISNSNFNDLITLWEGDSVSTECKRVVKDFLSGEESPVVVVLDSNHTEEHVLAELEMIFPLLPINSFILVADTLISELPENYHPNRPWNKNDSPYTAIEKFIKNNDNVKIDNFWSKRAIISEFRGGYLKKLN